MDRIWRATINSWNGLVAITRSEAAFREEIVALVLSIPLAFFLTDSIARRFALIGSIIVVMVVELLNTAIEKLSDRVTRENDPLIGHVKDMGSAAVGITLLLAASLWLWIAGEWLWAAFYRP